MSFWKSFILFSLMTNSSLTVSDYSGPLHWINSIPFWDTRFLLYFWGNVFIISAVFSGLWCISQSSDLLHTECCETKDVWDCSPAYLKTSRALGLGHLFCQGTSLREYVACLPEWPCPSWPHFYLFNLWKFCIPDY